MRQPPTPTHPAHPALRQDLPAAIVLVALWSVDVPVQAWRHTVGPSVRWLGAFSYLFLLITVVLLLWAGYRSTRATGRLRTAALAGAISAAPPATVLIVLTNLQTLAGQGSRADVDIAGYLIAFALFAVAGALIGAVVSLPAALVARSRYRKEHAAEREREREAEAQRRARQHPVPRTPVVLGVVAAASVVFVSLLAALLAYTALSHWVGLAFAAAALAVGGALLAASNRTDWLGYVFDWLAMVCLCIGTITGLGELTGYLVGIFALGAAELVYIWRLGAAWCGSTPRRPPSDPSERPSHSTTTARPSSSIPAGASSASMPPSLVGWCSSPARWRCSCAAPGRCSSSASAPSP